MSVVRVELSVPSDAFAVGSILQDHHDVRIDLAQFVPIGEAIIPYFWVETDDRESFEKQVRADDRVATLTAIDTAESRTLYKVEWAGTIDGFLSTVAEHGLVVESATGTAERWRFRLQGPDRENLSSFQRALRDSGVPATIHHVWNPEVTNEDQYGLTPKQRETLELAFEEGYYEVPRDTSLAALSDTLGVSHQSTSRRMRGGLRNLLANTLMGESDAERR